MRSSEGLGIEKETNTISSGPRSDDAGFENGKERKDSAIWPMSDCLAWGIGKRSIRGTTGNDGRLPGWLPSDPMASRIRCCACRISKSLGNAACAHAMQAQQESAADTIQCFPVRIVKMLPGSSSACGTPCRRNPRPRRDIPCRRPRGSSSAPMAGSTSRQSFLSGESGPASGTCNWSCP